MEGVGCVDSEGTGADVGWVGSGVGYRACSATTVGSGRVAFDVSAVNAERGAGDGIRFGGGAGASSSLSFLLRIGVGSRVGSRVVSRLV
jgi:hypothetical protein